MDITVTWIDDTGAHSVPVNAPYFRKDGLGYLDNLRTGQMWNIVVRDADNRDVTSRYL